METELIHNITLSKVHQLMEWKRYKEALDEALKLLQEDPDDSETYSTIALIHYYLQQYDNAIHWSDQALSRDPENLQAWYVKTLTYYDTENWKQFDLIINEALSIDPDESIYYFLLANRQQVRGKHKDAKESMLSALELYPNYGLYLANLSYIEALLRNFDAAEELEREALLQDVESRHVFLYLAWSADQRGDDEKQLLYLKQAIQLDPDNDQIRNDYLEALQKNYAFYRIILAPTKLLKRMKPWQIFLSWAVAWILFKPLLAIFIVLYVLAYWGSKLLVHIKVFGWKFGR